MVWQRLMWPRPGTIGIGDEITAGGNEYYIVARRGGDTYAVQTATGAKPSDLASTAITDIERTFNTLDDAESMSDNAAYLNNTDITTSGANVQLHWALYDDGPFTEFTDVSHTHRIEGYTTEEDRFVRMYAPTGTLEVPSSQRHDGTADTGVVLRPAGTNTFNNHDIVEIFSVDYFRIEGIEIDGSDLLGIEGVSGVQVEQFGTLDTTNTKIFIEDMLIHDLSNDPTADIENVRGINVGEGHVVQRNNIIYNIINNTTEVDVLSNSSYEFDR